MLEFISHTLRIFSQSNPGVEGSNPFGAIFKKQKTKMKKEGGIILCICFSIAFASFVSASYACSDGSDLEKISRELDIGEAKSANGLSIGLTNVNERLATDRLEIDLFIDAVEVTLTNETPSESVEFADNSTETITLVNSTDNNAKIRIGSTTELMEENWMDVIGGIHVFLTSSEGIYPGEATVEILVADNKIFLTNYDNPEQIVTVGGEQFLVGFSSASEESAVITVSICDNSTIEETEEDFPETPINNSVINNTDVNGTNTNDTNVDLQIVNNSEINDSDEPAQNDSGNGGEEESQDVLQKVFLYALIAAVLVFFILLFRYLKSKALKKAVE